MKSKAERTMNCSWFAPSVFLRDFTIGHIAWGVTSVFAIFVSHHSSALLWVIGPDTKMNWPTDHRSQYNFWTWYDCTANYRPASSERAPYMKKKESNCHSKKFEIWSSAPKVGPTPRWTGWLTVSYSITWIKVDQRMSLHFTQNPRSCKGCDSTPPT
jgi:hypothetical protein